MDKITFTEILTRLNPPVPLTGLAEMTAIEASVLAKVDDDIDQLKKECFPDTALETLDNWERYLGIETNYNLPIVTRQRNALIKYYGRRLDKSFFLFLGRLLGHKDIVISDYRNLGPRCGVTVCGDVLSVPGLRHVWYVKNLERDDSYSRCGDFYCGERLGGDSFAIEDLFNELKPAWTVAYFQYKD